MTKNKEGVNVNNSSEAQVDKKAEALKVAEAKKADKAEALKAAKAEKAEALKVAADKKAEDKKAKAAEKEATRIAAISPLAGLKTWAEFAGVIDGKTLLRKRDSAVLNAPESIKAYEGREQGSFTLKADDKKKGYFFVDKAANYLAIK